ncbi:ABC-2 transporter permease [Clostridium novyi]|uniref:ABC-2 transporter permease n=1 Tax=Clostridium novyi TaxID=1542 RepID=UPI000A4A426B|nr:ABC-2 transporter permease [Clostridium novyi]
MFNLIFKDIKSVYNKKNIIAQLIYMPMMIYVIGDNYMKTIDVIFFMGAMFIISYGMMSFYEDEKSKWDIVVNSLPVQRSNIVFYKYFNMIIQMTLYVVFLSLVITLGNYTTLININLFNKRVLMSILNMSSIVLIFTAVVFPIYFKYGVTKMRSISILISICIFAVIGASGVFIFLYRC